MLIEKIFQNGNLQAADIVIRFGLWWNVISRISVVDCGHSDSLQCEVRGTQTVTPRFLLRYEVRSKRSIYEARCKAYEDEIRGLMYETPMRPLVFSYDTRYEVRRTRTRYEV